VWLYAGAVSLILPDVRFGMVSLTYKHVNQCKVKLSALFASRYLPELYSGPPTREGGNCNNLP